MSARATYEQLQPRLARAAKGRRRKEATELYPRVRAAMTALLKQEIRKRSAA